MSGLCKEETGFAQNNLKIDLWWWLVCTEFRSKTLIDYLVLWLFFKKVLEHFYVTGVIFSLACHFLFAAQKMGSQNCLYHGTARSVMIIRPPEHSCNTIFCRTLSLHYPRMGTLRYFDQIYYIIIIMLYNVLNHVIFSSYYPWKKVLKFKVS